MYPTPAQAEAMAGHCAHARLVWNVALEQARCYDPYKGPTPTHAQRCAQLTEARRELGWLRAGSQTVQQQALRDFDTAMTGFFDGTAGYPTWRRHGVHEGFRQVGVKPHHIVRLSARWAQVMVPKVGMVKFRLTRPVPDDVKSYRVTLDRSGRWHVAFAIVPPPIQGPGDSTVVGVDRGVAIAYQASDGRRWDVGGLTAGEQVRLRRLERQLARQRRAGRGKKSSNRYRRTKSAIARLHARVGDRRRDAIEKATTDLAATADLIRLENLDVTGLVASARGTADRPGTGVRAKAGLNREIHRRGWAMFQRRLTDKAPGRVELVPAAYTSQRCSACGHIDPDSRESQARFRCRACGHSTNADVNAAINIAAGHAVTARRAIPTAEPDIGSGALATKREPQLV